MTHIKLCRNLLALGTLLCAAPAFASSVTYTFGSDNDGLAGFTQNTTSSGESWTTQTDSVQYRSENTGFLNGSFLREIVLDRTAGNAYRMTGVITMTDGYADDNNRVGLYFFGDFAEPPNQDEAGSIGLIFNTDDGVTGGAPGSNADDQINLRVGIDSGPNFSGDVDRTQTTTPFAQDLFGTQIVLSADIIFTEDDMIQMTAKLTTSVDGEMTLIDPILVDAASYTGDYFGFVTRARSRNFGDSGDPRSNPWVMDYESFTVQTIPEPTAALTGLAFGGLCLMRRRRA